MRAVSRFLACLTLLTVVCVSSGAGSIESDPIVVRVASRALPLSSLAKKLGSLASFQRRALGATDTAQGQRYLEQVLVPDLLLAEHGRTNFTAASPRRHAKENALLRNAFITRLERQIIDQSPITDVEVRSYYDAHPELFIGKERLRLQRLLVASEGEAKELIVKAQGFTTMDDWRNLVRVKSLDKATSERGGELGFVAEDGSTEIPEFEVDPALFAAAQKAKDGELIATPVAEGKRFAVLWRRGSRPAQSIDFASESRRIRQHLLELRVEQRLTETLTKLRQSTVREYRPELLEAQDFTRILERGFSPSPIATNAKQGLSTNPAK